MSRSEVQHISQRSFKLTESTSSEESIFVAAVILIIFNVDDRSTKMTDLSTSFIFFPRRTFEVIFISTIATIAATTLELILSSFY